MQRELDNTVDGQTDEDCNQRIDLEHNCYFTGHSEQQFKFQIKNTTKSIASPRTPHYSMMPIVTFTFDQCDLQNQESSSSHHG